MWSLFKRKAAVNVVAPPPNSLDRPIVAVSEVEISDGSTITIDKDDIVLIVGPNNSGKSAFLKNLKRAADGHGFGNVIRRLAVTKIGSDEDFSSFIEKNTVRERSGTFDSNILKGLGFVVQDATMLGAWRNKSNAQGEIFFRFVGTEDRLTASEPARSFSAATEAPQNPIQVLYLDTDLELKVSTFFRKAFGEDLFVHRLGGSQLPLFVGVHPELSSGEYLSSPEYLRKTEEVASALVSQGDGMRAYATIIVQAFAAITPSVLLLDEPEAFLHPPQAKALAEALSSSELPAKQFFISTHSPEILSGFLSSSSHRLKIIRIIRKDKKNIARILDRVAAQNISNDPLMKFSGVLNGIFHRRVIVCEGDSDCLFYSAILDVPAVHGDVSPDVLFIHGGGKQRMPQLAWSLKVLGVDVDVIADLDVLNDEKSIRNLVDKMGGDWNVLQPMWKSFYNIIESGRQQPAFSIILSRLEEIMRNARADGQFSEPLKAAVREAMSAESPWDLLRIGGEQALPAGDATAKYRELKASLAAIRIWLVPVGQLEGFCKEIAGKTGWAQRTLEGRSLSSDPSLALAREFMSQIWRAGA